MGAGKRGNSSFLFFSHFALILALDARALSSGRKKRTVKKKNEKKETKTEKKRITSVDRLNVPLS